MKCPNCQSTVSEKARFCSNCGTNLKEARHAGKPACTKCGAALKPNAKFCQNCGTKQSGAASEAAVAQDWEEEEIEETQAEPRRDMKYILLPLIFVPVLVGIFYLLSFRSQNPESQSAEMTQNTQPDMSQMMPVFKTIDSLRTVLQQNPADTTALLVLGEMYEMAGKFEQARDYYNKYLAINTGRSDIELRVLGTLINEHKHEQEEQLLAKVLEQKPDDPHTFMHVGDLYERAGKLDKARFYYEKSLEAKPGQVDIFMRQAGLFFTEEDYASAQKLLGQVLEKQPANPHALYNYALAVHLNGEHEKAVEYWQKAIAADPNGNIGNLARQALTSFENIKRSN
jgi:cytochrome c-type biogenesis protein CcmH/NrfG